jgi:N-methylhydantoinase B
VSDPVQRALAEIAPGFSQAETGPIQPLGLGVISGKDPRHEGAPFVNQVHRAPRHCSEHRGRGHIPRGPSIYGEFGPIEGCTMKVFYTADGTINSAMGARRGRRGALAQVQKRGGDGSLTVLRACYGVALEPGEFVVSHSAGGGGYGPPFERDLGRVLHDLRERWITAVRARSVYGVVTTGDAADDTLAVDAAANQSLRSQMRAAASGPDLTSEA